MCKIFIQIILISFISHGSLMAQETPIKLVETFFEQYKNHGISVALDTLYSTNKWVNKSQDMIVQLKSKMQMELENVDFIGEMHGYETIVIKSLNSSFKLYSYLVKYDRQPIRFTFQFYKPKDDWMIYSFQYDGELSNELEESAKIYYDINRY